MWPSHAAALAVVPLVRVDPMTGLIVPALLLAIGVVAVAVLLGADSILRRIGQVAGLILAAATFPFWAHRIARRVLENRRVAPVAAAGHPTALDEEVWANGLTDAELVKREGRYLRLKARDRLHGQDIARFRAVKRVLAIRVSQSKTNLEFVRRRDAR